MKSKILLGLLVGLMGSILVNAEENTVGLIRNDPGSFEGYTLFSPMSFRTSYLINNEGLLVHSWQSEFIPGYMAYLTEDGCLYRTFITGGTTGISGVEKLDWDGNLAWRYNCSGDGYSRHHDIAVLPSGNVLMIVLELKDSIQAIEAGANPATFGRRLYSESVIEVRPNGPSGGDIVWQWHAWDHLVQNYDSTKDNYGMVKAYPELINLNAEQPMRADFMHVNSIGYNEEFDQIVLTSRIYSEIWVIDHGTTTEEAAGHAGGRYGKGGDLLYRWGNPRNYGYGTLESQKLFYPHAGTWVESGMPGAGNILIFNNGGEDLNRIYSSVDEITPPVDTGGNYQGGLPYGPTEPCWSWNAPEPGDFFSVYISGAQRLPNGNTLICDGPHGALFEVTPDGEEVWRYVNPVISTGPIKQGTVPSGNDVFKIRRYALDYPAFEGRDLAPKGPIELSGVSEGAPAGMTMLEITPVLIKDAATISYQLASSTNVRMMLYDVTGSEVRMLVHEVKSAGGYTVSWDGHDDMGRRVSPGVYFVTLETDRSRAVERIVVAR